MPSGQLTFSAHNQQVVGDRGRLRRELAERLPEGEVGHPVTAEVEAVAGEDLPSLDLGAITQLDQQPTDDRFP